MPILIKKLSSDKEYSVDGLTLAEGEGLYVSTTSKNKGRWYYEFTHVDGSNYHLIGFIDGNTKIISYYAFNSLPDSSVFINSNYNSSISSYAKVGFNTVSQTSTIGLGIDLFGGRFIIRSSHQIAVVNFDLSKFNTKDTRAYFQEANAASAKDTINVNFGEKKFAYDLLPGFVAWNKTPNIISCFCRTHRSICAFAYYIFLLVS